MVVPAHTLMTWSGVFGSTTNVVETWQFSLKSEGPLPTTTAEADALAEDMSTAWETHLVLKQSQDVTLTACEIVRVAETGLYETLPDGSYRRGLWDGAVTGAVAASPRYPLSVALAVSLVTARPGPTGKGRFFLPAPPFALDSGYRLDDATVGGLLTAVKSFINAVVPIGGAVVVASSKGYTSPVTGVKIGKVLDTMRSRRGDQVEGYLSVTL